MSRKTKAGTARSSLKTTVEKIKKTGKETIYNFSKILEKYLRISSYSVKLWLKPATLMSETLKLATLLKPANLLDASAVILKPATTLPKMNSFTNIFPGFCLFFNSIYTRNTNLIANYLRNKTYLHVQRQQ